MLNPTTKEAALKCAHDAMESGDGWKTPFYIRMAELLPASPAPGALARAIAAERNQIVTLPTPAPTFFLTPSHKDRMVIAPGESFKSNVDPQIRYRYVGGGTTEIFKKGLGLYGRHHEVIDGIGPTRRVLKRWLKTGRVSRAGA